MPTIHPSKGSRHHRAKRIAVAAALAVAACAIVWIFAKIGFVYVTLD